MGAKKGCQEKEACEMPKQHSIEKSARASWQAVTRITGSIQISRVLYMMCVERHDRSPSVF